MYNSRIIGMGKYLPDNVVTNDDLAKLMDTSDEWITERTGIKERRHIVKGSDDTPATMGHKAALIALERAGLQPKDIDLILFATESRLLFPWFRCFGTEIIGNSSLSCHGYSHAVLWLYLWAFNRRSIHQNGYV